MIAIKRDCLDPAELEQVLCGQMAKDDFDSAISHLDNCDACRSAADAMQQDGRWLVESLDRDKPDPLQAETACQVALWRMLETPIANPAVGAAAPCEKLGPYQLTQALGTGGMGTVYLAEHERLKRQCAIKLLPRERVDQPGWLERFDREMTTIAALEHPNVVRATDAGNEAGWHYLVMEYLDGLDVGRIASRMGQLQVADACEIVRQAALGLAHVHNSGLVHRDVKPSNLMLTRRGVVKILDLGLVLAGDDPLSVDDRLTTVGHLMGTMPYMAPEQLADSRDVDPRADIYSLGATLYRLIAGRPPHQRHGGLAAHILAISNEDPPPLDSLREDVDRDVIQLVGEMLARDPADRPKSAEQVADRLSKIGKTSQLKGLLREAMRRLGSEEQQTSVMPSVSGQASQPPSSRIWKWIAGGFFAGFLLLAAIVIKIETDKGDLIVHSEYDGLTVVIKKGEEVVDRLSVKSQGENRKVLRKGSYQVEIEGGGEALALSDEVVTIGRGTQTPVRVVETAAVPQRVSALPTGQEGTVETEVGQNNKLLYQGKDLAEWTRLLNREQDPKSLGRVIRAVEVLTRDMEERAVAAAATLQTARRWGGSVSSWSGLDDADLSDEPASHVYMHFLMRIYPGYLPDPGIAAITQELTSGNNRSRMAALWLLKNYLNNVNGDLVFGDTAPRGRVMPNQWITETYETSDGAEMLDQLYASLKDAVVSLTGGGRDRSAQTGVEAGIRLRLMLEQPISGESWLQSQLTETIQKAEAEWSKLQEDPTATVSVTGFDNHPFWIVDENILVAASQLADGLDDVNWAYYAAVLMDGRFRRQSDRSNQVFEILDTNAPDLLYQEIESKLVAFLVPGSADDHMTDGGGMGGGGMGGGIVQPYFVLAQKNSVWSAALPLYAKRAKSVPEALTLLRQLRERLKHFQVERVWASEPFAMIDAAIKTLERRE